jgi:hypothetical protein
LEGIKVLKEIQMNICPNQKCQKKFENLIIVHDNSKMPADIYYACPYCLVKLDPTATQVLKKEEIFVEVKKETKRIHPEREIPTGCPQYLGYLFVRPKDAIIPQECLICSKMLDCALKNGHLGKQSKREGLEYVEPSL